MSEEQTINLISRGAANPPPTGTQFPQAHNSIQGIIGGCNSQIGEPSYLSHGLYFGFGDRCLADVDYP